MSEQNQQAVEVSSVTTKKPRKARSDAGKKRGPQKNKAKVSV
jgi:hypothetical protein